MTQRPSGSTPSPPDSGRPAFDLPRIPPPRPFFYLPSWYNYCASQWCRNRSVSANPPQLPLPKHLPSALVTDILDTHYTPSAVAKALVRAMRDLRPALVADLAAGNGDLLLEAERVWPNATFVATDIDRRAVRPLGPTPSLLGGRPLRPTKRAVPRVLPCPRPAPPFRLPHATQSPLQLPRRHTFPGANPARPTAREHRYVLPLARRRLRRRPPATSFPFCHLAAFTTQRTHRLGLIFRHGTA